jgi:hypothetical protein
MPQTAIIDNEDYLHGKRILKGISIVLSAQPDKSPKVACWDPNDISSEKGEQKTMRSTIGNDF